MDVTADVAEVPCVAEDRVASVSANIVGDAGEQKEMDIDPPAPPDNVVGDEGGDNVDDCGGDFEDYFDDDDSVVCDEILGSDNVDDYEDDCEDDFDDDDSVVRNEIDPP